ncbi:MAG: hypothetical protein ABEI99_05660, partial [Halobaculum sp.]
MDRPSDAVERVQSGLTGRRLVLIVLLLAALLGTGIGFFDPFQSSTRQGVTTGNGTPPTTPPPAPTVTVTPPGDPVSRTTTETASGEADGPVTTATATPTATDGSAPSGTATSPSGTATGTATASTTATATPNVTTRSPSGPNASLNLTAEDPPTFRNDEGRVPEASGVLGGTLRVSDPQVDSVVLVLQVWVPFHGWTVRSRVAVTDLGSGDSRTVNLESVFGYTTYADRNA